MTEHHVPAPELAGRSSFPRQAWLIGGAAVILVGAIGWLRAAPNDKPPVRDGIQVVRGVSHSDASGPNAGVKFTEAVPSTAPASQPVIDPAFRPLADAMRRAYPEISDVGAQCAEATCTILAVLPATVEQAANGRSSGTLSEGIERVLSAQGYEPLQQIQFEEISAEDIRARITLTR
jgi:hypothetical protein